MEAAMKHTTLAGIILAGGTFVSAASAGYRLLGGDPAPRLWCNEKSFFLVRVAIIASVSIVAVGGALANELTYTETATISGSLAGQSFSGSILSLTASADTANIAFCDGTADEPPLGRVSG
jgi:hypothetical protein